MKTLLGRNDNIQDSLERLDRLTKDEGLSATAQTLGVVSQTLGVVHGIADGMKMVIGGAHCFRDFSRLFVYCKYLFH